MQTIRAILLMILAMALLALSDLFIKLSAQYAPLGQVMFCLSAGGTAMFMAYAVLIKQPLWLPEIWHPMVLTRNAFEIIAAIGLVFGIAFIPLTTFAAIMQVAPILVVLGGALFLGEDVGWRRWAAVIAGLIGMLIVIRPGGDAFSIYTLFAVMGVSGLAGRDLVTRLAPAHVPSIALSTWGFFGTIPAGLAVFLWQAEPFTFDPLALTYITLAALVTTSGYFAITNAMRMAPVSIVSPFRYTRLVFTTLLGLIFLKETLDVPTIVGASIILMAGIYTFLRERRLALATDRA